MGADALPAPLLVEGLSESRAPLTVACGTQTSSRECKTTDHAAAASPRWKSKKRRGLSRGHWEMFSIIPLLMAGVLSGCGYE